LRKNNKDNEMADEHWHLDKKVNLSHMVTTMILLISGVVYVGDIDTKVEKQGIQIESLQEKVEQQRDDTKSMFTQLRSDMKGIDQKLDKLIDRELSK